MIANAILDAKEMQDKGVLVLLLKLMDAISRFVDLMPNAVRKMELESVIVLNNFPMEIRIKVVLRDLEVKKIFIFSEAFYSKVYVRITGFSSNNLKIAIFGREIENEN